MTVLVFPNVHNDTKRKKILLFKNHFQVNRFRLNLKIEIGFYVIGILFIDISYDDKGFSKIFF